MDEALQALVDKQAITEILYRYCRAVDRQDADLLRTVYHPDAEDLHGIYNGPISGLFEMRGAMANPYVMTSHTVSNILIQLHGDSAHVESYLSAIHRARTSQGLRDDFLRCRYVDRFERRAVGWRIARRVVIYDWGESRPAVDRAWWDEAPGEYIFGRRDGGDRLYAEGAATLANIC